MVRSKRALTRKSSNRHALQDLARPPRLSSTLHRVLLCADRPTFMADLQVFLNHRYSSLTPSLPQGPSATCSEKASRPRAEHPEHARALSVGIIDAGSVAVWPDGLGLLDTFKTYGATTKSACSWQCAQHSADHPAMR
jgi:hypothetical protein